MKEWLVYTLITIQSLIILNSIPYRDEVSGKVVTNWHKLLKCLLLSLLIFFLVVIGTTLLICLAKFVWSVSL